MFLDRRISFSSLFKLYSILKSMQPIILLGVAVAAAALVGTGFLNDETWNEFTLVVQSLGWGEDMLNSPLSHAFVDLEVKKLPNDAGTTVKDCEGLDENSTPETEAECIARVNLDDYFDNVIQSCSFHGDKNIPAPPPSFPAEVGVPGQSVQVFNDGIVICKMLNEDENAIAEGKRTITSFGPNGYEASKKEFIPILQCITETGIVQSSSGEPANCLDVQTPIHFVKLVVENALWNDPVVIPALPED